MSWWVNASGGAGGAGWPGPGAAPAPPPPDLGVLFRPEPLLLALYVPTVVTSLFANVLLVAVTVKYNYTKNVTSVYLVNLCVADLLVTCICMPVQLSSAVTLVWYYGLLLCKSVNYLQGVAVAASVFTIAAMSVDRMLSICPAPRLSPPGRRAALALLAALWLAALLIFLPLLAVAVVRTEAVPVAAPAGNHTLVLREVQFCTEQWAGPDSRRQFGIFSFVIVYAVPGSVTIASYAVMGRTLCSVRPPFDIDEGDVAMQQGLRLMSERRRVARTLLLLALVFAACWLPYNSVQLLLDLDWVQYDRVAAAMPYALYLGHANSAINPIVYCLMTKNFQRSARRLLCARRGCRPTTFTWRCTQKPEGSSSDYDRHKKCFIQMDTFHYNSNFRTIQMPTYQRTLEPPGARGHAGAGVGAGTGAGAGAGVGAGTGAGTLHAPRARGRAAVVN